MLTLVERNPVPMKQYRKGPCQLRRRLGHQSLEHTITTDYH